MRNGFGRTQDLTRVLTDFSVSSHPLSAFAITLDMTSTMVDEPIELQTPRTAPSISLNSTPTTSSQTEQLDRLGLSTGPEDDGLPPQDRGRQAWTFVAAAFVLE